MFSTHRNPTGDAPAAPLQAQGDARTFARRIDCAQDGHDARYAAPARGGGRREPDEWERVRRGLPY